MSMIGGGEGGSERMHCKYERLDYVWLSIVLMAAGLLSLTWPKMLCNGNGAILHLQTEMGFVKDFHYSLYNW